MPTNPIPTPRRAGGCVQPVLVRGRVDHIDGTTGELLHRYTSVHEPGGLLPIACKTRRASRCPPCAEVYRADTYQLIKAGLTGGKGIPDTVASHPCVFVTLTAPHSARSTPAARKTAGYCDAIPAAESRPARTAAGCPAPRNTLLTTTSSGILSARTATTTPAQSCSTPALPSYGGGSPSPCAAPWPAAPE